MLAELPLLALDFVDASGSVGSMQIRLKAGTTAAAAQAAAAVLRGALEPMSGAVCFSERITYGIVSETLLPTTGSEPAAHSGVFIFECSEPDSYAVVNIPAINATYLAVDGPGAGVLIDQSNANVSAFISSIIDSIWSNPFANDIVAISAAYLQWR